MGVHTELDSVMIRLVKILCMYADTRGRDRDEVITEFTDVLSTLVKFGTFKDFRTHE